MRAAIVAALLFVPEPALADDRPLGDALTVATDGDCLTHAALSEHLATWLGRDELDARVAIVIDAGGDTASFEILRDGEPAGTRRFERLPASCADRRAVVTLALALALDDGILASLTAPAETIRPEVPVEVARAPSSTASSVGVGIEVEVSALLGLFFDPVLLGGVDVRVLLPEGLSLRVGAIVTTTAGGSLGSARVEAALAGGRVSICLGRVIAAPLSLGGCLGVWAGAVHAEGRGFAEDRSVDLALVAPRARLEARVELLPWLALFIAVEGLVSALRPQFRTEGGGANRDLGDVGLSVGGGAELVLR